MFDQPELRQEAIDTTRRVLYSHGITTVDLTDGQLLKVINFAHTLMAVGGRRPDDWDAWKNGIQWGRFMLGYTT